MVNQWGIVHSSGLHVITYLEKTNIPGHQCARITGNIHGVISPADNLVMLEHLPQDSLTIMISTAIASGISTLVLSSLQNPFKNLEIVREGRLANPMQRLSLSARSLVRKILNVYCNVV